MVAHASYQKASEAEEGGPEVQGLPGLNIKFNESQGIYGPVFSLINKNLAAKCIFH